MTGRHFLDEAVRLAFEKVARCGRPFGAVVVQDGKDIARAVNRMESDNDPTAHARLLALRLAGRTLAATRLEGCAVHASGQPCPMGLAAMRLAGITEIANAHSNADGAPYCLSTAEIAAELSQPLARQDRASIRHLPPEGADRPNLCAAWADRTAPDARA